MEEILTRTVSAAGTTPLRAYAALRAKAPGRTSFLLEGAPEGEPGERRSIIGFLVKQESAHPPASDVFGAVAQVAGQMPPAPASPEAAASCVLDFIVLLMFDAALPHHGAQPWPDQAYTGREVSDLASVTFDADAGTLTIAAKNLNVIERMARVIAEAPELPDLPPAGGSLPQYVFEHPPDPAFAKQYARAQRRLALGGIERLLLPRSFAAPARSADPLDVHRALADLTPGRRRFFVDLAASPLFAACAVTGTTRPAVSLSAGASLAKDLLGLFSMEASCGAPAKDALSTWRELGGGPLGLRGGALLRLRAGGAVEALPIEAHVTLENGQLQTIGSAEVREDRDMAGHLTEAQKDAAAPLAAIRRAHDAAEAREAAVEAAEPPRT